MNIFILLGIFVAATANESVDDASVALQMKLKKRHPEDESYIYIVPQTIWLEFDPLFEPTQYWAKDEESDYSPDGNLNYCAFQPSLLFEGTNWQMSTLVQSAGEGKCEALPLSPLILKSKQKPREWWVEAQSVMRQEMLGFVHQLACSWKFSRVDDMLNPNGQWFPVLPEGKGGKTHKTVTCGWSFEWEVDETARGDTYWEPPKKKKNRKQKTIGFSHGQGHFTEWGGKIETVNPDMAGSGFKLNSPIPPSGDVNGMGPGSLIRFRSVTLALYPGLWESKSGDSAYDATYKRIVKTWGDNVMKYLVAENVELEDGATVKGFAYFLVNRILAILARNPKGINYQETKSAPDAFLAEEGAKQTKKFPRAFGILKMKHFNSPVVDLTDMHALLRELGGDATTLINSFWKTNILDVDNEEKNADGSTAGASIATAIYRMVEEVSKAAWQTEGLQGNVRFQNEGDWNAVASFCLNRLRSDTAFMMKSSQYVAQQQEAEGRSDGTIDKGGCDGFGLMDYLQYVFDDGSNSRSQSFTSTNTINRDNQFQDWFGTFYIKPFKKEGPQREGPPKTMWDKHRLWAGLENQFGRDNKHVVVIEAARKVQPSVIPVVGEEIVEEPDEEEEE